MYLLCLIVIDFLKLNLFKICMLRLILALRKRLDNMLIKLISERNKVWAHLRKERFPNLRKSELLPRGNGNQEPKLRINSFQEGELDEILKTLEEEPQARKERKESMESKVLQGLMTKGRIGRLQEEVLKEIGLLRVKNSMPKAQPSILYGLTLHPQAPQRLSLH
ncbi:hypothetical protein CR513_03106, partial [Mucuna pruriens]